MSDPAGPTFATAPVVPGRGRPPWLAAGLVVAVVVGSIVIARLTPVAEPIRPVPSVPAGPSPVPAPTTDLPVLAAAALPLREWFSGSAAPIDDLLIDAGGVRWLRLAGARLTDPVLTRSPDDLLLQTARDETTCLCWQPSSRRLRRSGNEAGDPRVLELVRVDIDLGERSRSFVTVVDGLDARGRPADATRVALAPSPDLRYAYLLREMRSTRHWRIDLDLIELSTGTIVDTVALLSTDAPGSAVAPAAGAAAADPVDPPILRVAHDGRHALVATVGPGRAWVVKLNGSSFGRSVSADGIAASPLDACSWIDFVRSRNVIAGCKRAADDGTGPYEIRRFDLTGQEIGRIGMFPRWPDQDPPLVDVLRGIAYTWDPATQALSSMDLVTGGGRNAGVSAEDVSALPAPRVWLGPRPEPGTGAIWSRGQTATAAIAPSASQLLVGSPDGTLLYAVGQGVAASPGSGVWVIEASSLRALEYWPALTSYSAITLFEGGRWFDRGRWLAAIGRPGVTATGEPAPWGTSVTILDTTTGAPILRLGDIGADASVAFPGVVAAQ